MTTSVPASHTHKPAASIAAAASISSACIPPRASRTVAMDIVALADIMAVAVGALLPAFIHDGFGGAPTNWTIIAQSGIIGGFICYLWLRNTGMYEIKKINDLPNNPTRLLVGVAIGAAAVIGIALAVVPNHWHITIYFVSWVSASFMAILLTRGIARAVLARMSATGRFKRSVAVFGAGTISRRVHDHLTASDTDINFVGVYDDRIDDERINAKGLEISGKLDQLLAEAYADRIDDIVVALPQSAEGRIGEIVRKLEQAPCNVHLVTHISSDLIPSDRALRVSQIGEIGLIDVKDKSLADWALLVKRAEDIIVASIGLFITAPILLVAMIAIKLESQGPVIYRQRRRGLNRQIIDVLKLRTLSVTDDDDQVRQVTIGDNRVTRVGRVLRHTSIDELPQLWNVLKGEMSIVGPRPHALVHDDQFGSMLDGYANRHQVKPGITGLAQVKGFRGETGTPDRIKNRVEQDIAYVRAWSLWLDIKIIAKTIVVVLTGQNAH